MNWMAAALSMIENGTHASLLKFNPYNNLHESKSIFVFFTKFKFSIFIDGLYCQ